MSHTQGGSVHPDPPAADTRTQGWLGPEPSPYELPDPGRWRALVVTQFAAFMVLLDVSIVNVALPSIERGLAVSAASAQWVVSGYALALGLTLVAAGRLGDSLGPRPMFKTLPTPRDVREGQIRWKFPQDYRDPRYSVVLPIPIAPVRPRAEARRRAASRRRAGSRS
jgi:hypothetical protein